MFALLMADKKLRDAASQFFRKSGFRIVLKPKERIFELQKQIDDNMLQVQLDSVEENLEIVTKLNKDAEAICAPVLEELEKKVIRRVKTEKANRGYNRLSDPIKKIEMKNHVVAPIADEFSIPMEHPIIVKIKRRFDVI